MNVVQSKMKDSGYGSSTFGEKIEDSEKHLSYGSATNSEDEMVNAHAGKHEINKSEETGAEDQDTFTTGKSGVIKKKNAKDEETAIYTRNLEERKGQSKHCDF